MSGVQTHRFWSAACSSKPGQQAGLSLVELLISMTLGLFVMAGILQILMTSKVTYRVQEAVGRVQENGRYAIDLIARDIRTAGYAGCTRLANLQDNPNGLLTGTAAFDADGFLWGADSLPVGNALGATPMTDSLTVRAMSPNALPLQSDMAGAASAINVPTTGLDWAVGDLMMIANCEAFDLFIVTGMSGTNPVSITPTTALSRPYAAGSLVGPLRDYTYAVKPDTGNANTPTLWRIETGRDTTPATELPSPIAEGVTDLQVRYLVGTDYVAASGITDWSDVQAVRVSLLVESREENVLPASRAVYFNGAMAPDADGSRRMRQVFTTTAGTRNRLP